MEHEPIRQYTSNGVIQKMLKEWTVAKVTHSRTFDMMQLWLGFSFTGRMDEKGRWRKEDFNQLRLHFNYRTTNDFIAEIRRTRSFFLIGTDETIPDFIASPNWYQWQEEDGPLLTYSLGYENYQKSCFQGRRERRNKENIFKENSLPESNPDGSEAGALTDEKIHEQEEIKRLKEVEVRDYFTWLMEQNDDAHKKIVNGIQATIKYTISAAKLIKK